MEDSFDIIYSKLGLDSSSQIQEDQLLMLINQRVEYYLEHEIDLLLSYLYRLDIDEEKINIALMPSNPESPGISLSKLILDRQLARALNKKKYKVKPISDEDW
jgi:hypothetical protein